MKKYIYIFTCSLAALILGGCVSFLEKEPLTTLSSNSFWNTENDLRLALNNQYKEMNHDWNLDNWSVDCFADVGNDVSSGTYTVPNTDDKWIKPYKQIRISNEFLENYEKASITEDLKKRYAGEARFFRAYYYYRLITRFGDVILTTNTMDIDSPELYAERTPKEDILKLMMEDLDFAETHIPLKNDMKNDVGRITKGAVQAFMARVCLYYGTWYKFRGEETLAQGYLQKAKEAAKRCMDSKQYSLYSDYRNLFLTPGEDSEEHIFSYRYDEVSNTYNPRIRSVIIDFRQEPTKFIADAFLCKDGLPIEKSSYKVEYLPLGKEFEDRDPRMALTLWKPGDSFKGKPFVPNLTNQTRTGYMFKKYGDEASMEQMSSRIDEILIRYAEVLLTYAEASYELNNQISDADLDISINVLRNRFANDPNKLPPLTNTFVKQHGLDMREEIRRERRVELVTESLRYDDLIRWKTAEIELPQEILGAKFDQLAYPDMIPGKDVNLNKEGFLIVQIGKSRMFDAQKDYLFPLPLREITLNPNLKQNPNW